MNDCESLYTVAAKLLCIVSSRKQSLKNAFYSMDDSKSKALFALVSKCLTLQPKILTGLYDTSVLPKKESNSHIHDIKLQPCKACTLVVVAYDLACSRKPFGRRADALKILSKNSTLQKSAASVLRKTLKQLIPKENEPKEPVTWIPTYLRINTLISNISAVLEELTKETYTLIPFESATTSYKRYIKMIRGLKVGEFLKDFHFPELLLVFPPGSDLHLHPLFISNHVMIQDKASCIPPLVLLNSLKLPQSAPIQVLDACAAPGNKTTLLISGLAQTQSESVVIALDRDEKRFGYLCENLRRYTSANVSLKVNGKPDVKVDVNEDNLASCQVEAFCQDFLSIDPNDEAFSKLTAILVDPSCSSSGVHCRRPELDESGCSDERIQRLANLQNKILRHALSFPSVQLVVYSTCSIYEQENEAVVREQAHKFEDIFKLEKIWLSAVNAIEDELSPFTPYTPRAPWANRGLKSEGLIDAVVSNRCVRSSHEKDLTIGFFVSCFRRRRAKLTDRKKIGET